MSWVVLRGLFSSPARRRRFVVSLVSRARQVFCLFCLSSDTSPLHTSPPQPNQLHPKPKSETQRTVNNQIVGGTLMSICDSPNRVSVWGDSWEGGEANGNLRIPIIVTGNDFSTLFAPLIRDGRMDKFYWDPDR